MNSKILESLQNTVFQEVLSVTEEELNKFITDIPLKEGEVPVGYLTLFEIACAQVNNRKVAEHDEMHKKMNESHDETRTPEHLLIHSQCKMLEKLFWDSIKSRIPHDFINDEVAIEFREGNAIVLVPKEDDGFFPVPFGPFGGGMVVVRFKR